MIVEENRIKDLMEKYVQDNFECIKEELIGYMVGYKRDLDHPVNPHSPILRSPKVIRRYLDELTGKKPLNKNPRIISKPDVKDRQTHRLYLNDENLYIQVKHILSKIEKDIMRYNEPIDKINKQSLKARNLETGLFYKYKEDFVYSYYGSTGLMLRHLRKLIKNMKFSEEDIQNFMLKIGDLDEAYTQQILGIENVRKEAVNAMNNFLKTKNKLLEPSYLGQHYINSKMVDEAMQTLDSFNKILSKYF